MFINHAGRDPIFLLKLAQLQYLKKGKIELERSGLHLQAGFCFARVSSGGPPRADYFLHPEEENYYHGLKFDRRRTSYLIGRLAAKHAVSAYTDKNDLSSIWIDIGVFGFPLVKCKGLQNIQASITHCQSISTALAFPEAHPMGIDLELIRDSNAQTIEGQITAREKKLLSELDYPKEVGYTLLWTVKEAFSKVLKTGMTMNFKLLEVKSMQKNEFVVESTFQNSIQYKAVTSHTEEWALSVVMPRKTEADLGTFWQAFREVVASE